MAVPLTARLDVDTDFLPQTLRVLCATLARNALLGLWEGLFFIAGRVPSSNVRKREVSTGAVALGGR